ncbi:MAG: hypothetical protein LBV42_04970 [Methanobrevibacter sp.]|jgi:hypothetical protein|nr:hypothetical protein [Methanobrevibacter sp.]
MRLNRYYFEDYKNDNEKYLQDEDLKSMLDTISKKIMLYNTQHKNKKSSR